MVRRAGASVEDDIFIQAERLVQGDSQLPVQKRIETWVLPLSYRRYPGNHGGESVYLKT